MNNSTERTLHLIDHDNLAGSPGPTHEETFMNITRERTLHLIDHDNLIGSPSPTQEIAWWCRLEYERLCIGLADQEIVACSHHAAPSISWEWPHARRLWRSGRDGADLALLEVIERERVAERFSSVYLASGDGIFTEAVAWLGAQGVEVTVVSRPESLSRSLMLAASRLILFPCPPTVLEMLGAPA